MSLLKIVAILFLGVAVVGGGTYLVINNRATTDTSIEEEEISEEEMEQLFTGGESSLRGLMALGQNIQCDFTSYMEETGGSSAGTVYVGGGRVRGDFAMEQAGVTMDSHMIVKDEKIYTWTVSPQGTFAHVLNLEAVEGAQGSSASAGSNEAVSLDERVDYSCRSWSVDESKFALPGGIEFQSMETMFNAQLEASGSVSGSGDQCAACAQILDANAKAQCLTALSCN